MNHFKEHRIGTFKVSYSLIDMGDTKKLLGFFGNFIIVEAVHEFARAQIKYTAYSLLFDPVPDGEIYPEYTIEITEHKDKSLSYRAVRINEPTCSFCHSVRSFKPRKDKARFKMHESIFVCTVCGFYQ